MIKRKLALALLAISVLTAGLAHAKQPNILWLTFEDTSASEFSCYGNPDAKTPTIDGLAKNGIQFMQAYSTAPYCSPARSTLITGCYATTYGMDNHRFRWNTPKDIFYPTLMRKAGYFCTNNYKTDYNTTRSHTDIWNECGRSATYNSANRKKEQPFFAVFNANITHMSRLTSVTLEGRRDFSKEGLNPETLTLPPHFPDLKETRSDYAFHLEGVQDIDKWVQLFLNDLKTRGLEDDTIIFVYSDHGGCQPRGKAFPYESGLRVPMIVHLPKKYEHLSKIKPGTQTDRLVGFVDFAPTLLSLVGVQPPARMQGRAFMGPYETEPRKLQFAFRTNQERHYDPCRAVTDGRWKYIRSYLPNKPFALRNAFQWQMPSNLGWDQYALDHRGPEAAQQNPQWLQPYNPKSPEMLFDLSVDPFELNNLAEQPAHQETLLKMRQAVANHIRQTGDLGFFPPSTKMKGKGVALYDWVKSTNYNLERLHQAAETASMPNPNDLDQLTAYLTAAEPEIRYWGAAAFSRLAATGQIQTAPTPLRQATTDRNPAVAATAAQACCQADAFELGIEALITGLEKRRGTQKDPFYSALEALTCNAAQRNLIMPYKKRIIATGGFQAKSIAINLGGKPAKSLYNKKSTNKGIETNLNRRPLEPTP